MTQELRERALLAFAHAGGLGIIPDDGEKWDEDIENGMAAAIALVLEEAAKVAMASPADYGSPRSYCEGRSAATAAIRALKNKP